MDLIVNCKGLGVSNTCQDMEVTLQNVDYGFISGLPVDKVLLYTDVNTLLSAMDYDDIVDYLESRYDIEPIKERK